MTHTSDKIRHGSKTVNFAYQDALSTVGEIVKLTLNFRAAIAPLTLDIEGDAELILSDLKKAIEDDTVIDFTDKEGERVVIPANAIAYAVVPARTPSPVGFGRM